MIDANWKLVSKLYISSWLYNMIVESEIWYAYTKMLALNAEINYREINGTMFSLLILTKADLKYFCEPENSASY